MSTEPTGGCVQLSDGSFSIGGEVWPGLSKLVEEAGEVIQVVGKIIATNGAKDHWDGSNLQLRLEDELADLLAAIKFVMDKNHLHQRAMRHRSEAKQAMFDQWHAEQLGR